jgi:hypothetical protein
MLPDVPCTSTAALRLYACAQATCPKPISYLAIVHVAEEIHWVSLPTRADVEAFLADVLPLLQVAARRRRHSAGPLTVVAVPRAEMTG